MSIIHIHKVGGDGILDLESFTKLKLETHKKILPIVKGYIDELIPLMGMEKIDNSTYFALILELTRSIFISWETEQRRPQYYQKTQTKPSWRGSK